MFLGPSKVSIKILCVISLSFFEEIKSYFYFLWDEHDIQGTKIFTHIAVLETEAI